MRCQTLDTVFRQLVLISGLPPSGKLVKSNPSGLTWLTADQQDVVKHMSLKSVKYTTTDF